MKNCCNCGTPLEDDATFCPNCGTPYSAPGAQPSVPPDPGYTARQMIPYDHTGEFTTQDISYNKVICMCIYLLSAVGVFIALLASGSSPYIAFHIRQALKITVCEVLIVMISLVLAISVIVPIVGTVMLLILFVVRIVCFVQICGGKAIEPAIVRDLGFLK